MSEKRSKAHLAAIAAHDAAVDICAGLQAMSCHRATGAAADARRERIKAQHEVLKKQVAALGRHVGKL
jgi:hypothetical protein